jgi:general secretion pathway protein G
MKRKGFTLIELLVVIAIIGLLSTLAVVALTGARAKARDARRLSDVKQIQTALDLYYADQNTYPADLTPGQALKYGTAPDTVTYMALVPTNPSPTNDGDCPADTEYDYTQGGGGITYHVVYCIGNKTGDVESGTHNATPAGIVDD